MTTTPIDRGDSGLGLLDDDDNRMDVVDADGIVIKPDCVHFRETGVFVLDTNKTKDSNFNVGPVGLYVEGKSNDVWTITVPAVNERDRFQPPLAHGMSLISDIVRIERRTKGNMRKKSPKSKTPVFVMTIKLPYKATDAQYYTTEQMWKADGNTEWTATPIQTYADPNPSLEIRVDHPGTYAIIARLRQEVFTVTTLGLLHSSKLSHYVSLRFAKRSIQQDTEFRITIHPLTKRRLDNCRKLFWGLCQDLMSSSDIIDIIPITGISRANRNATFKLPLPPDIQKQMEDEIGVTEPDNVAVLLKNLEGEWKILPKPYKYSKTTISVDNREFGRFWVVKHNPFRTDHLCDAAEYLTTHIRRVQGELLVFVKLDEKRWRLLLEHIGPEEISQRKRELVDSGWLSLDEVHILAEAKKEAKKEEEKPKVELPPSRFASQKKIELNKERQHMEKIEQMIVNFNKAYLNKTKAPEPENAGVELTNGDSLILSMMGNIDLRAETANLGFGEEIAQKETEDCKVYRIPFHEFLRDFSVVYTCVPTVTETQRLISRMRVYRSSLSESGTRRCERVKLYALEIDEKFVEAYFDLGKQVQMDVTESATPTKSEKKNRLKSAHRRSASLKSYHGSRERSARSEEPEKKSPRRNPEAFKRLTQRIEDDQSRADSGQSSFLDDDSSLMDDEDDEDTDTGVDSAVKAARKEVRKKREAQRKRQRDKNLRDLEFRSHDRPTPDDSDESDTCSHISNLSRIAHRKDSFKEYLDELSEFQNPQEYIKYTHPSGYGQMPIISLNESELMLHRQNDPNQNFITPYQAQNVLRYGKVLRRIGALGFSAERPLHVWERMQTIQIEYPFLRVNKSEFMEIITFETKRVDFENFLKPTPREKSWLQSKSLGVKRDNKALSGRSLMVLSKQIPDGLLLGVNLGLNDSAITGLGFDALSNGLSLSDVTYRILLSWKRKSKLTQEDNILHLCSALRGMNRQDIAVIVELRFQENAEITSDSFDFLSE